MTNWGKVLHKKYRIGLSVMTVIVLSLLWWVQGDRPAAQSKADHSIESHSKPSHADVVDAGLSVQHKQTVDRGGIAYHTCSMHPSVRSAHPGTCPICAMDLLPVTHEALQSGSIFLEEGRRQSIGVKTGKVVSEHFELPIRLQGEFTIDPGKLRDISLHFDGWIGDLNADFKGKTIQKGDMLFSVYSPQLLSLQEEYLQSFKRTKGSEQGKSLLSASRKRLSLWGLQAEQIAWLERQGRAQNYVPIFSPTDGVVIEKNIVSGSAFKRGQRLLRLADLSSLWLKAYAYEQDLALIKPGMKARVHLPNLSQHDFSTTVLQVDPFLNNNTRTAWIRLPVNNNKGNFKPGQFARVTLKADLGINLLIPEDAVMIAGEKRIVFLDMGEGRLKPQTIKTGYSDGEYVVVRQGLLEGDAIVISGNFLIAAESKLKSGLEQW